MRHDVRSPAAILAFALCLGPSATDAAPETAPAAAAAPAARKTPGPPEIAWKDMSAEARTKYMKTVVTPKMKVLFQEFDPVEFKKFNCETCHGKDPKARKFKMPGPDVHPLPGTPAAFEAKMKEKPTWPKWTKFMGEKVDPQMAGLLGLPLFDPKKPVEGAFGCQFCHTIEK